MSRSKIQSAGRDPAGAVRVRWSARCLLAAASLLSLLPPAGLRANPSGGAVAAGAASITADGTVLTIEQATDRLILDWQSFDIGVGETTRFVQPGALSAVLNRIGSGDPTEIFGALQANGLVYVVNPAGILVGAGGTVDTAGFVATTASIPAADFLAGGDLRLTVDSPAAVVNLGRIGARDGDVFLVARQVENGGTIAAPVGTAALAAGAEVLLQRAGDRFAVQVGGPAEGAVVNQGLVEAAQVELRAAGGNPYALAVNNGGALRATGLEERDGRIFLTAPGARVEVGGTVEAAGGEVRIDAAGAPGGTAVVTGTVSAAAAEGSGGTVVVLGENVGLGAAAALDASGPAGGGEIFVGGGWQGGDPALANAANATVLAGAQLRADATAAGDGGTVVVWADGVTRFAGAISARGGPAGGDGGAAEVSGAGALVFAGAADLRAPGGVGGTLLLDPFDLRIVSGPTSNIFEAAGDPYAFDQGAPETESLLGAQTLADQLALSDVVVTSATGILVEALVSWNTASILTLGAAGNVTLEGGRLNAPDGTLFVQAGGAFSAVEGGFDLRQLVVDVGGPVDLGVGNRTARLAVSAAGDITAELDGDTVIGGLGAGEAGSNVAGLSTPGNVSISLSGSTLTLEENVTAGGSVALYSPDFFDGEFSAEGNLYIDAAVEAVGTVDVFTGTQLDIGFDGSVRSTSADVLVTAGYGTIDGTIAAAAPVTINAFGLSVASTGLIEAGTVLTLEGGLNIYGLVRANAVEWDSGSLGIYGTLLVGDGGLSYPTGQDVPPDLFLGGTLEVTGTDLTIPNESTVQTVVDGEATMRVLGGNLLVAGPINAYFDDQGSAGGPGGEPVAEAVNTLQLLATGRVDLDGDIGESLPLDELLIQASDVQVGGSVFVFADDIRMEALGSLTVLSEATMGADSGDLYLRGGTVNLEQSAYFADGRVSLIAENGGVSAGNVSVEATELLIEATGPSAVGGTQSLDVQRLAATITGTGGLTLGLGTGGVAIADLSNNEGAEASLPGGGTRSTLAGGGNGIYIESGNLTASTGPGPDGSIIIEAPIEVGGMVTLNTFNTIYVEADVVSDGFLYFDTSPSGSVEITNGATVESRGDSVLLGDGALIELSGTVRAASEISVQAPLFLTGASTLAAPSINFSSASAFDANFQDLTLGTGNLSLNFGPAEIQNLGAVTLTAPTAGGSIGLGTATGTDAVYDDDFLALFAGPTLTFGGAGATIVATDFLTSAAVVLDTRGGGSLTINGTLFAAGGVEIYGDGTTLHLSGDIITAGTPVLISDSVILDGAADPGIDTTNGGAVPAGADITLTGSVNDDSTASTLVLTAGQGNVSLTGAVGDVTALGGLNIQTHGTVSQSAAWRTGFLDVTSTTGDILLLFGEGNDFGPFGLGASGPGLVEVDVGSGGLFLRDLSAGTKVYLDAGGDVTQATNSAITSPLLLLLGGGNFDLPNAGNDVGTVAGQTGNLTLTNGADLTVGTIATYIGLDVDANLQLTAPSLTLGQPSFVSGAATLAADALAVTASLEATTFLWSGGAATLGAPIETLAGDISLVGSGTVTVDAPLTSAADLALTGGPLQVLKTLTAAGSLTLTIGDGSLITAALTAAGGLTIDSAGPAASAELAGNFTAGTDLTLAAGLDGFLTSSLALNATAGDATIEATLDGGENLTVNAGNRIELLGQLGQGAPLDRLGLNANGSRVRFGGAVSADEIDATANTQIVVSEAALVESLGSGSVSNWSADTVTFVSGAASTVLVEGTLAIVVGAGGVDAAAGAIEAEKLSVSMTSSSGAALDFSNPDNSIETFAATHNASPLTLRNGRNLTVGTVGALTGLIGAGAADIASTGTLTVDTTVTEIVATDGLTLSGDSGVNLFAFLKTAGTLTLGGLVTVREGYVELEGATVRLNGGLDGQGNFVVLEAADFQFGAPVTGNGTLTLNTPEALTLAIGDAPANGGALIDSGDLAQIGPNFSVVNLNNGLNSAEDITVGALTADTSPLSIRAGTGAVTRVGGDVSLTRGLQFVEAVEIAADITVGSGSLRFFNDTTVTSPAVLTAPSLLADGLLQATSNLSLYVDDLTANSGAIVGTANNPVLTVGPRFASGSLTIFGADPGTGLHLDSGDMFALGTGFSEKVFGRPDLTGGLTQQAFFGVGESVTYDGGLSTVTLLGGLELSGAGDLTLRGADIDLRANIQNFAAGGAVSLDGDVALGANVFVRGAEVLFGGGVDGAGLHALTVQAGQVDFVGGTGSVHDLLQLTLQPTSDTVPVNFLAGSGGFEIDATDFAALDLTTIDFLDVGRAGSTAALTIGAADLGAQTRFQANGTGGRIEVAGALTGGSLQFFTPDLQVGADITGTGGVLLGGPTTLTGSHTLAGSFLTFDGALNAGAFDPVLRANGFNFFGGAGSVSGSGTLKLHSTNPAGFDVGSALLGTGPLADGFAQVRLFSDNDLRISGPLTFTDPVVFDAPNGDLALSGALIGTGNASFTFAGDGSTFDLGGSIVTAGTPITINDSVVLQGLSALVLDTTGGGAVPAGAAISLGGPLTAAAATPSLTLLAGAGAVTLGGTVTLPDTALTIAAGADPVAPTAAWLARSLALTVGGSVTLGADLTVTDVLDIEAGGAVALNQSAFGELRLITPGEAAVVRDGNILLAAGTEVGGVLTLETLGLATTTGPITAGSGLTFRDRATGGGTASLTLFGSNLVNGDLTLETQGGSVTVEADTDLSLGSSSFGATVALTTSGSITQSGPLSGASTSRLRLTAGDVILDQSANVLGEVFVEVDNLVLLENHAITLETASTVFGDATFVGDALFADDLFVAGLTTVDVGGDLSLTGGTDLHQLDALVGTDAAVADQFGLELLAFTVLGDAAFTLEGALTNSAPIDVGGGLSLALGVPTAEVNLTGDNLLGGPLEVNAPVGGNVSVEVAGALELAESVHANGILTLNADFISQSGPLVADQLVVDAYGGAALDHPDNRIGRLAGGSLGGLSVASDQLTLGPIGLYTGLSASNLSVATGELGYVNGFDLELETFQLQPLVATQDLFVGAPFQDSVLSAAPTLLDELNDTGTSLFFGVEGYAGQIVVTAPEFGGDVTFIAGSLGAIRLESDFTAAGSVAFDGPVPLSQAVALDAGGSVNFARTVDGPVGLTVTAGGDIGFFDAVGLNQPLAELTVQTGARALFAGAVTVNDLLDVRSADVSFSADVAVTDTLNGGIILRHAVEGETLTLGDPSGAFEDYLLDSGEFAHLAASGAPVTVGDLEEMTDVEVIGPLEGDAPLTLESAGAVRIYAPVTLGGDADLVLQAAAVMLGADLTAPVGMFVSGNINLVNDPTLTVTGVGAGLGLAGDVAPDADTESGLTLAASGEGATISMLGSLGLADAPLAFLNITTDGFLAQNAPWFVEGTLAVQSGTNAVRLDNAGNRFGTVELGDVGASIIAEEDDMVIAGISTEIGVELISGGSITQTGPIVAEDFLRLSAADEITLDATGNDIGLLSTVSAGGDVTIVNDNEALVVAGSYFLPGHNFWVSNTGDLTVATGVDLRTGAQGVPAGTVSLVAGGALVVEAGATIDTTPAGPSTGTTIAGNVSLLGTLVPGSAITLEGAPTDDLIISVDLISANAITLTALRDVIITARVESTGGNVNLTGDSDGSGTGGIRLGAAGAIVAAGNVTLAGTDFTNLGAGATGVALLLEGNVTAGGDLGIFGVGATAGRLDTTGNWTAGGEITLGGFTEVRAGGVWTATAGSVSVSDPLALTGTLTLSAGADVSLFGSVRTQAGPGGPRQLNIDAGGDLLAIGDVGGPRAAGEQLSRASLAAGGELLIAGTLSSNFADLAAGSLGGPLLLQVDSILDLQVDAGDVTLSSSGGLVLGNVDVPANLTAFVATTISQSSAIAVGGAASFTADTVNLFGQPNVFSGPVSLEARNVNLTAAGALVFDAVNLTGLLTANPSGDVSQTAPMEVAEFVSISTPGTVTLTDANNTFGGGLALTAATANVVTDGTVTLLGTDVAGLLAVTSGGGVLQTQALDVGDLAIDAAEAIVLDRADNAVGGTVALAGLSAILVEAGDIAFGAVNLTGALNAQAGGAVTQTDALAVAGASAFNAAPFAVILDDAGNNFGGPVSVNAGSAALRDINALVLGASTVASTLTVTAGGDVSQSAAVDVGGAARFETPGDVTLNSAGNRFGSTVALNAGSAFVFDNGPLALAASTVTGDLAARSSGAMTQTGALSVGGDALFNASNFALTLGDAGNDFGGAVTLLAGNAVLRDSGALALAASTVTGSLTVTAGGAVSQTGALSVAGATAFDAAGFAVTLDQAGNDFGGAVTLLAGNAVLRDSGALALGASTVTGDLTISTGGDLTQNNALVVGGLTSLDLGGQDFALLHPGNDLARLTFQSVAEGSLVDLDGLTLEAGASASGRLTLTTDGLVNSTGPVTLGGLTALGTGGAALDLPGENVLSGEIRLTGFAGGVTLGGAGQLNLADLNLGADGTFSAPSIVQTGAALVLGTATFVADDVNLPNAGNDFGVVALDAATAVLADADDLTLAAGSLVIGNLTVTGVTVGATDLLVGGTATFNTSGDVLVAGESDLSLLAFTVGGDLAVSDANGLTVVGGSSVAGNLALSVGGTTGNNGTFSVVGDLSVAVGGTSSAPQVILDGANTVGGLVNVTSDTPDAVIEIEEAGSMTLGTVVVTDGTLALAAGSLAQTEAVEISALDLTVAGDATLDDAGNSIGRVDGAVGGDLSLATAAFLGGNLTAGSLALRTDTAALASGAGLSVGAAHVTTLDPARPIVAGAVGIGVELVLSQSFFDALGAADLTLGDAERTAGIALTDVIFGGNATVLGAPGEPTVVRGGVTAAGDLAFDGAVAVPANGSFLAANVTFNGPLDGPGAVDAFATGNLLFAGPIGAEIAPEDLTLTAGGALTLPAPVTVGDFLDLAAGSLAMGGTPTFTEANASVRIQPFGGSDRLFLGGTGTGGLLVTDATLALLEPLTVPVEFGALDGYLGDIVVNRSLLFAGDLLLRTGGEISLDPFATIESFANIELSGTVQISNPVSTLSVDAGGDLIVNGPVMVGGGFVGLRAGRNLFVQSAEGEFSVDSEGLSLLGETVTIQGLVGATVPLDLSIVTGGGLMQNAPWRVGTLEVSAGGAVELTNPANQVARLAAYDFEGLTLVTLGDLELGQIEPSAPFNSSTVILNAGGDITQGAFDRVVLPFGGLSLNAGGAVSLTSAENNFSGLEVVAPDGVTVRVAGESLSLFTVQTDGGAVDVEVAGDLTVGTLDTSLGQPGGTVRLVSVSGQVLVGEGSAIDTTPAGTPGAGLSVSGNVVLEGTVALGAAITLRGAETEDLIISTDLVTDQPVNLSARRDIVVDALIQSTGGVSLTADSNEDGLGGILLTAAAQIVAGGNVVLGGARYTTQGDDLTDFAILAAGGSITAGGGLSLAGDPAHTLFAQLNGTAVDINGALDVSGIARLVAQGEWDVGQSVNLADLLEVSGELNVTAGQNFVADDGVVGAAGAGTLRVTADSIILPAGAGVRDGLSAELTSLGVLELRAASNLALGGEIAADRLAIATDTLAGQIALNGFSAVSVDVAAASVVEIIAPAGLELADNGFTAFPGINLAGSLLIEAGGPVTQSGVVDVGLGLVIDAPGQVVSLPQPVFVRGGTLGLTAGSAALNLAGPAVLSASTVTGDFSLLAEGDISQTGPLVVGGRLDLAVNPGSSGVIFLPDVGNVLPTLGDVVTNGGDVQIFLGAGDATLVGAVDTGTQLVDLDGLDGQVDLSAGGRLTVAEGASILTGSGNHAALDIAGAVTVLGEVTGSAPVFLSGNENAGNVILGHALDVGGLSVLAPGTIEVNAPVRVGGEALFFGNLSDPVGVGARLAAPIVAETLRVDSGGVLIELSADLAATSLLVLEGDTRLLRTVTLTGGQIDLQGALDAAAAGVGLTANAGGAQIFTRSIGQTSPLAFLNLSSSVQVSQNGPWAVDGLLSIQGLAGEGVFVNLAAANRFGSVSLTGSTSSAIIREVDAMEIAALETTGEITLEVGGDLTQTGPLTLRDGLELIVDGRVTLTNPANQIGLLAGITAEGDVSVVAADTAPLEIAGSIFTEGGNLALTTAGDLNVNGFVTLSTGGETGPAGTLDLTAGGQLFISENVGLNTLPAGAVTGLEVRGNVVLNSTPSVGSRIRLTGAETDDLIINAPIVTDQPVNLSARRDIVVDALIQSTGGVTLTADSNEDGLGGIRLTALGQIVAAGDVALFGSAFTNLGTATGGAAIVAEAGSSVEGGGDISFGPTFDPLEAGSTGAGSFRLSLAGSVDAGGDLSLGAFGFAEASGDLAAGGDVTVATDLFLTGDLTVSAGGHAEFGGLVAGSAGQNLTVSAGAITLAVGLGVEESAPLGAGAAVPATPAGLGTVALFADAGLTAAGVLRAQDLGVRAGFVANLLDVAVDGEFAAEVGDGLLFVRSDFDLTVGSVAGLTGVAGAADLNLSSDLDLIIGAPVNAGNIRLEAERDIEVNAAVTATNDGLAVEADGDFDGLGGVVVGPAGSLSAADGVAVTGADYTAGGTGATGTALRIEGAVTAGDSIALTLREEDDEATPAATGTGAAALVVTGSLTAGDAIAVGHFGVARVAGIWTAGGGVFSDAAEHRLTGDWNLNAGTFVELDGLVVGTAGEDLTVDAATGYVAFERGVGEAVSTPTGAGHPAATSGLGTVRVAAGTSVSFGGETVRAENLAVDAAVLSGDLDVALSGALALRLTADSSQVVRSTQALTVGTIGTLSGITLQLGPEEVPDVLDVSAPVLTVNGPLDGDLGAVTLRSTAGNLTLGDVTADSLRAVATGSITEAGALAMAGTARFEAPAGTVNFTLANNTLGVWEVVARDLTLNAPGALALGTFTLGGFLDVTAGGAVTQAGALDVTGATTVRAGANAVTLPQAGNNLSGPLALTAGSATVRTSGPLALATSSVAGALALTSGGAVTQTGPLTAGSLEVTAGGAVTLANPANAVPVLGDVQRGGAFDFLTAGPLTLQGSVDAGTLASDVTIGNRGGNLTIGPDAAVATSGVGNDLVLHTDGELFNQSGADALGVDNGARWVVYAATEAGSVLGGLLGATQYSVAPLGAVAGTGNVVAYAQAAPPPPVDPSEFADDGEDAADGPTDGAETPPPPPGDGADLPEADLDPGDVAEVRDGGVNSVNSDVAPPELGDALGDEVRDELQDAIDANGPESFEGTPDLDLEQDDAASLDGASAPVPVPLPPALQAALEPVVRNLLAEAIRRFLTGDFPLDPSFGLALDPEDAASIDVNGLVQSLPLGQATGLLLALDPTVRDELQAALDAASAGGFVPLPGLEVFLDAGEGAVLDAAGVVEALLASMPAEVRAALGAALGDAVRASLEAALASEPNL